MNERHGTIKSYIEGPIWARSDIGIKNVCWQLGLSCTVERETSWLKEIVRFKIEGAEAKLVLFKEAMETSIHEWNNS